MTTLTASGRVTTHGVRLIPFLTRHEGFVGRTYRDAGGVPTIGYGFTMLSRTFADYWRERSGHGLRSGDVIEREEADRVLAILLASEYAPPVAARFAGLSQHAFDAATSVTYNAGAATLRDSWAGALAGGDVAQAAALLRRTRVTAGGKRIAGLVKRRADEADLLAHGDYGDAGPREARQAVRAYQAQLAALGFYATAIDGVAGPLTRAAVRTFQRQHGLAVDGLVGPATRAALVRALEARASAKTISAAGLGGAATGGVAGIPADAPAGQAGDILVSLVVTGLAAAALVAALCLAWRYRGLILQRRTPI